MYASGPHLSKTRLVSAAQAAAAAAFVLAAPAHAVVTTYTHPTAWAAALSQAPTLIDFDGLADNTPLAAQYSGVNFDAFNGGSPLVVNYSFAQTGLNLVALSTPPLTGGGGGVAMDFAASLAGVGFWYLDSEFAGNGVTVRAAGNALLTSYEMVFPAPAAWRFVGFVDSAGGIRRLEVAIGAADMVALDSLMFAAAPVPEPTRAALALTGAALLFGLSRGRRAMQARSAP